MSKKNPLKAAKKMLPHSIKSSSSRQNESKNTIKSKMLLRIPSDRRIARSLNVKNPNVYHDIMDNIQSEALYRLLADHMKDYVWIMDLDLNWIYISPSIEKYFGYTLEELKQIPLDKILTPTSFQTAMDIFSKEISGIEKTLPPPSYKILMEFECFSKESRISFIENTLSFILDENGKPVSILGEGRDITERKIIEEELRRSEEKYRTILENVQEGYSEIDIKGNYTFFNDATCEILGYSREELTGMNYREYMDKETAKKASRIFNNIYKTGNPLKDIDWQITRKDGSKRHIDITASLIKDSSGKPTGFRGFLRDITKRKQIEAKLLEEQQRFRALADQSSDIIVVVDRKGNIIYENKSMETVLGYKPEERIGANALDHVHPDDKIFNRDFFRKIFTANNVSPLRSELRIRHKDGSWRICEEVASSLSRNNIVESIIVNLRDITERKKMECQRDAAVEALRKSEKYFREITEHSSDILIITDKDGIIKYCSRTFFRFIGYKPEEVLGKNGFEFVHPDDVQRAAEDYARALQADDNTLAHTAFRVLHKNGSEVHLECIGRNSLNNPDIEGFIMNVRDITQRIQTEEKLHQEEERFRALAEQSSEIIVLVNKEGIVTYENPAVEKILGFNPKERIGISAYNLLHPADLKLVTDTFSILFNDKNAPAQKAEIRLRHENGSWRTFDAVASHLMHDDKIESLIINLHDITDRKKSEHALQESRHKYRKLSIIDDLTQLYNSRHFHAQLKKEIERSNRYEQPLTLMLTDIDKFKEYNDKYGHVEGDNLLSRLGKVIKRCLRDTDSAYRYGGEEFTIMLPMTQKEEGILIANRIRTELRKEAFCPEPGLKVNISMSIGLSQYKSREEMKSFVSRVDQLMYKVKKTERGNICSDDGNMQ
jgi:diguanylate cyclase (GGDEF)-like protein/PAS domain S-box-containing protein